MGADAEGAEKHEHRGLGRGDRRLGVSHPGQPRLLLGARLLGEGRRREDRVVKARAVNRDEVGRLVPDAAGVFEGGGDAAAHADILAALAGEEEGEAAGFGRREVEPPAAGDLRGLRTFFAICSRAFAAISASWADDETVSDSRQGWVASNFAWLSKATRDRSTAPARSTAAASA